MGQAAVSILEMFSASTTRERFQRIGTKKLCGQTAVQILTLSVAT
jgi:hypothetical protein